MNANFNLYINQKNFKRFFEFQELYGEKTSSKIMELIDEHMNKIEAEQMKLE